MLITVTAEVNGKSIWRKSCLNVFFLLKPYLYEFVSSLDQKRAKKLAKLLTFLSQILAIVGMPCIPHMRCLIVLFLQSSISISSLSSLVSIRWLMAINWIIVDNSWCFWKLIIMYLLLYSRWCMCTNSYKYIHQLQNCILI